MLRTWRASQIGIVAGGVAVILGLLVFTLSWTLWSLWDGPMPGYQWALYPGNLLLIYLWHPLFSEEIHFWPKLGLLLLGQFAVVSLLVGLICAALRKILKAR